jgi:hypothetical protein
VVVGIARGASGVDFGLLLPKVEGFVELVACPYEGGEDDHYLFGTGFGLGALDDALEGSFGHEHSLLEPLRAKIPGIHGTRERGLRNSFLHLSPPCPAIPKYDI